MAGDHHGPAPFTKDPAIERFYAMRENMADHFKYTRKSGRFVLLALGVVPAILLYGAYKVGVSTLDRLLFVLVFANFVPGPSRFRGQASR